jgi:hypothetical protein
LRLAEQRHGEERDQHTQEHPFGQTKYRADLAVEFLELDLLDHLGHQVEADPNDERSPQEQDQHGQKHVPGGRGVDVLGDLLAEHHGDDIARHQRCERGDLPGEALPRPPHNGGGEDDDHEQVVALHGPGTPAVRDVGREYSQHRRAGEEQPIGRQPIGLGRPRAGG